MRIDLLNTTLDIGDKFECYAWNLYVKLEHKTKLDSQWSGVALDSVYGTWSNFHIVLQ